MSLIPWPSGPPQPLLHLGANGSEPHPGVTVHSMKTPQPWAPQSSSIPRAPHPSPLHTLRGQSLGRQETHLEKETHLAVD